MSIKDLDFFALVFGFTYNRSVRFKTLLGGYLALIFIIIMSVTTSVYIISYLNKERNITFNTGAIKYGEPPSLNLGKDYKFIIGIYNNLNNEYLNIAKLEEGITIKLFYIQNDLNNVTKRSNNKTEIDLHKCEEDVNFDFNVYNNASIDLSNLLCSDTFSKNLYGNYDSEKSGYYKAQILSLKDRSNVINLNSLTVVLYTVENQYDWKKYDNPISKILISKKVNLISGFNQITNLSFNGVSFRSVDYSILIYEIDRVFNYFEVDYVNLINPGVSCNFNLSKIASDCVIVGEFNFLSGIHSKTIIRNYLTLSQIITQISGIMNVLFFVFSLLNLVYAENAFYTQLTKDNFFMFRELLEVSPMDSQTFKDEDLKDLNGIGVNDINNNNTIKPLTEIEDKNQIDEILVQNPRKKSILKNKEKKLVISLKQQESIKSSSSSSSSSNNDKSSKSKNSDVEDIGGNYQTLLSVESHNKNLLSPTKINILKNDKKTNNNNFNKFEDDDQELTANKLLLNNYCGRDVFKRKKFSTKKLIPIIGKVEVKEPITPGNQKLSYNLKNKMLNFTNLNENSELDNNFKLPEADWNDNNKSPSNLNKKAITTTRVRSSLNNYNSPHQSILNFSTFGSPVMKRKASQFKSEIRPSKIHFDKLVSHINNDGSIVKSRIEKDKPKEVVSFHILRFMNFKLSNSLYSICCLSFCCCFKKLSKKAENENKLYEFSKNYFEQFLDFNKFMQKFIELDLIKNFLFNEEQLNFINKLKKIIILDNYNFSNDINLHELFKGQQNIKGTQLENLAGQLQKFYARLVDKPNKTNIESNLLEYLQKLTYTPKKIESRQGTNNNTINNNTLT